MDQRGAMNKTSQSLSSKFQSDCYCTLPPLTPHPNGHNQLESTEQSLYELRAMFEYTSLYLQCNT